MDLTKMNSKTFGSKWAPHRFEKDFGEGLRSLGDKGSFDYWLEQPSCRIELKSARENNQGNFIFQYIHPDWFEVCVCLAVWQSGQISYWVFTRREVRPHLSSQHREQGSFKLHLSLKKREELQNYEAKQNDLRIRVLSTAKTAQKEKIIVRLHPAFSTIEGWSEVKKRLAKQVNNNFVEDWQIRILPVPKNLETHDKDLIPQPKIFPEEKRMDYFARPVSVVGEGNIRGMVLSILDFFVQFIYPDL